MALCSFTFYEDNTAKRDLVEGAEYDVNASDGAHFISIGYAIEADAEESQENTQEPTPVQDAEPAPAETQES